jgi:hypothetical protein
MLLGPLVVAMLIVATPPLLPVRPMKGIGLLVRSEDDRITRSGTSMIVAIGIVHRERRRGPERKHEENQSHALGHSSPAPDLEDGRPDTRSGLV